MDLNNLKQQLLDLQMRLNAIVALVVNGTMPTNPSPGSDYPTTEAPRAMDACKVMWQNAQQEDPSLFNIHDFIGRGLVQGATPGATPRMSQRTQDELEAAILALGRSEWGQRWLSDDRCAAAIDARYCYGFVGYFVTKNPDDTYERHYRAP